MKRFFSTLLRFILCNLVACVGHVALELCLSVPLSILSEVWGLTCDLTSIVSGVGAMVLTVPAMYWIFFRGNKSFRRTCADAVAEGLSPREVVHRTLTLPALFVLLLGIVAACYEDPGTITFDTMTGVVLASARLFTGVLPEIIFGSNTLLTRLPGALVWGALIAVTYILLNRLACHRFSVVGYVPRKPRVPALLIGTGLVFEGVFAFHGVLFLAAASHFEEGTEGWSAMLTGILHVTVCMILYLVEAIIAVARQRNAFAIVKLSCIGGAALILTNTLFYGTAETIIAMVCMAGVTGLEIAALIRYRKIPASPTPASPKLGISSENADVYDMSAPPSSTLPKESGESYGVTEDEVVIVYEMPKDGK